MASNRAIEAWRQTLGDRAIELLAPQHGPIYRGAAVREFLAWLDGLECGVDLLQPGGVFRR
jgi:flavorubredoxin